MGLFLLKIDQLVVYLESPHTSFKQCEGTVSPMQFAT
jgi:hypothetical protein